MKHRIGQKYFRFGSANPSWCYFTQITNAKFSEFLKSEYSDENILFWQACEVSELRVVVLGRCDYAYRMNFRS